MTTRAAPTYRPDDLLSLSEALKVIPLSQATLYRAEAAGKITTLRTPGGHRRYRYADLLALLTPKEDGASA